MLIEKISLEIFLDTFALKSEEQCLIFKKMPFQRIFTSSKLSLRFQGGVFVVFFPLLAIFFRDSKFFKLQVVLIKIFHLVAEDKSS